VPIAHFSYFARAPACMFISRARARWPGGASLVACMDLRIRMVQRRRSRLHKNHRTIVALCATTLSPRGGALVRRSTNVSSYFRVQSNERSQRDGREERSTRDQASCDCEGSASAPWLSRLVARRLSALARRLPGHSGPSGQVSAPRMRPSRKWLWTRRRARLRADAAAAALRGRAGRGARRLAAAGIRSSRR
jgi:hypothetical protein